MYLYVLICTCLKYGLPDPLQYLDFPWRPDRWRVHCKKIVEQHWTQILKTAAETETLKYLDTEYASTTVPMRIWQLAGLCAVSVKQTTVVNWMILGTYFTRELLHKMKKVKSPLCLGCEDEAIENLEHLLLQCTYYSKIR